MRRMYVIVDSSLTKSQRIPQASHAIAEFVYRYSDDKAVRQWVCNDRTLVCLQSDSRILHDYLEQYQGMKAFFIDQDLNDMLTACAFGPLDAEEGNKLFGQLKLA